MTSDNTATDEPLHDETAAAIAAAGHHGAIEVLEQHVDGPVARHRRLALDGLARLGRLDERHLGAALHDADARVRRTAARLAAQLPSVDLTATLADPDPLVVETAAWSMGEQATGEDTQRLALEQLAAEHDDPLCREAAVAALGAIAHPDSLGTLLGAARDKAPVRRRAVLALVSYDGPDVDAALDAALEDRDWQVRQAAEDVR